jgi:hypothetical protein
MMNDFRNIPKDNYSQEAAWQKLYVLSEQWKSNLLFYKDDIRFSHHLIDTYSLWISKNARIERMQEMEVNLLKVDQECALLLERTICQLQYLAHSNDDPFRHDSQQFRAEHKIFEEELAQLLKDCKTNWK